MDRAFGRRPRRRRIFSLAHTQSLCGDDGGKGIALAHHQLNVISNSSTVLPPPLAMGWCVQETPSMIRQKIALNYPLNRAIPLCYSPHTRTQQEM